MNRYSLSMPSLTVGIAGMENVQRLLDAPLLLPARTR